MAFVDILYRDIRRRQELRQNVRLVRDLYMQGRYDSAYFHARLLHINERRTPVQQLADGRLYQVISANGTRYEILANSRHAICEAAAACTVYQMLRHYADYDILATRRPVPPPPF